MKKASDILLLKYDEVIKVLNQYNVIESRIFGSIFNNEDTENSDLDLIVKLPEAFSLIDYGKLKFELESLLQLPIDMLTYAGLNSKVLERFVNNSVSIEDYPSFKADNLERKAKTKFDRLTSNLNSIVWIINRIEESCKNISLEAFMNNELMKDAVTRNIQLLSQVTSQIPLQELEKLDSLTASLIKGCIPLKEALFMNVDYKLLWITLQKELILLKKNCEKFLKK
ncbi:nucleotidyltransferase domain-containing protein [Candidatus Izemoplasma sp. B36]|uniref:nucleotidyltransferase domain-containing protein n=1 Tax=Candidatus Izemoplasma sp. B36 TaxID=3242468 RepID=UPI0035566986